MSDRRIPYIAIDGPIGVGKTSLARAVAKKISARLILEAAVENPFLKLFYENMDEHAFQTQIFFLVSRFKQQQELLQSELFDQTTVTDYIFQKDQIFAQITLTADEYRLYSRLQEILSARVARPDRVIYLQADIDVLMQRVRSRKIAYENKITRDYLERVSEAYEHFFFDYDASPLLVVNTNEVNLAQDEADIDDLIAQLMRLDSGTQYYIPVRRKGK